MTTKTKLKLALYISILIGSLVLLILPADFFDEGSSICVSVVFFDTECFGCGMTRAVQHLIHLDFKEAYEYNMLSFIVFPLIVYLVLDEGRKLLKVIREEKANKVIE